MQWQMGLTLMVVAAITVPVPGAPADPVLSEFCLLGNAQGCQVGMEATHVVQAIPMRQPNALPSMVALQSVQLHTDALDPPLRTFSFHAGGVDMPGENACWIYAPLADHQVDCTVTPFVYQVLPRNAQVLRNGDAVCLVAGELYMDMDVDGDPEQILPLAYAVPPTPSERCD